MQSTSIMKYTSLTSFLNHVSQRNAAEPEFIQAVCEVAGSVWPYIAAHPRYSEQGLLDRMIEPERVIQFRVSWVDDTGATRVNRAWRVQHSSSLGPYKGGMRFHPEVTLSVLKFLALEQTFKNALTTLPMGGGKGGSDFDPKGRSSSEVMRFCQALTMELFRHIGADTDVPAGDMGVGQREVGYMAGMMKKLTNNASAAFTGKSIVHGGSFMRPEATGYGTVYFAQEMLALRKLSIEGMRVSVSGSGNVAQYAIQKAMSLGAIVVTASDSTGFVHDPEGFTPEKFALLQDIKNLRYGRIDEYALEAKVTFHADKRPWHIPVDVALPCAVQNEIGGEDARTLVKNGVVCVAEGANMPVDLQAIRIFQEAGVAYAPGKASNAGGVATSGLEMSQNAMHLRWTHEEVDQRLLKIMRAIHETCLEYGQGPANQVNYVNGANIAGFVRVADAMLAQGIL